MTIASKIKTRLNEFETGEVFTIQTFGVNLDDQPTLVRYLNRLVEKRQLSKLTKGRYFKPKSTRFGLLPPRVDEVIKDLLIKDGRIIGYLSGTSAFAKLGLTTQISSNLLIGSSTYRRPMERTGYKIRFFLQRNELSPATIPFLQILDAIKYFRDIPASTPDEAISGIIKIFKTQSEENLTTLAGLALQYPNYVRALSGAILEAIGKVSYTLKQSLNGVTVYRLNVSETTLPTKHYWNII